MSRLPSQWKRLLFNTLGYALARKDDWDLKNPTMPPASPEVLEKAAKYFRNRFELSPRCRLTPNEIEEKVKGFFWHYPFQFGELFVNADLIHFRGLQGRHYQRYFHLFPPILERCGGSLASRTVLEIGCNAGFWSMQARLAGAESVLGVDLGEKNVAQANFILELTGLDGIEYRTLDAYSVGRGTVGEWDITFFLGLLYHVDKPFEALERLYEVTRQFAVVDTTLARSDVPAHVPVLKLEEDRVHDQNYSNRVALVPSKSAVPLMLRHVGFREVYWIRNAGRDLPLDYQTQARMTFVAVK